MGQLPAYYQAQQAGLDSTKNNAFDGITDNARSRGMLYSGAPIQEQQKYLGSTYMPAVAGLQKDRQAQEFGLKNNWQQQQFKLAGALGDLTHQQYSDAYGIQQRQQSQDDARRAAAAQASQFAGLFGGGGGQAQNQAAHQLSDPGSIIQLIQQLRQSPGGTKTWNWGNLTNELSSRYRQSGDPSLMAQLDQNGKIKTGSPADIALNKYFANAGTAKAPLSTSGGLDSVLPRLSQYLLGNGGRG